MKIFWTLPLLLLIIAIEINAQTGSPMRRPVSPEQPMWLIHIDTWNYPDPQKIIELVPKDIRPYVVMNISLSINHDTESSRFKVVEYGYETAKSWLRVCAENRMWAMIQPASGGYCHFPDNDMTIFEEFYKEYPNFVGFNYAEQFWGYGDNDPLSPEWSDRMTHLASLLELSNKYGGFLAVSICWNKWGPGVNPIGMLKRSPEFAAACSLYPENYILLDKHTQESYLYDRESMCLGAYLSGFSGNYGIRYDDTGWTDGNRIHENFTMATYGAPFLEHTMLTGLTVFDGPELIWTQCFREVSESPTSDGYNTRQWETFPQFDNVSVDLFRKILDGTVRIPSRKELIDRTKFVIINDVNSGSNDDKYSSPVLLYQGLYRMNNDGNWGENKNFFKKTGRYPTIPIVYNLNDDLANTFEEQVNKSDFSKRWPNSNSKIEEFNNRFKEEYTGDIYAGRYENGWVIYNPYKKDQTATGTIPFKYNTTDSIQISFSQYSAGVLKEYTDYVTIYLSNFDNELNPILKTDEIKIYGSISEPGYEVNDRGSVYKSKVHKEWVDGIFSLTIDHNGPIDITINCSGNATDRLTEFQTANLVVPDSPLAIDGPRQYEAETFEYKNINEVVKSGYSKSVRNYTGQGYLNFGTGSNAGIRDHISVLNDGTYELQTRYTVAGGDVNSIDLYVNGEKHSSPLFAKTPSIGEWAINTQKINLNKGDNTIEYIANSSGKYSVYFDNIVIVNNNSDGIWMEAECGNVGSQWEEIYDRDASNSCCVMVQPGIIGSDSISSDPEKNLSFDFNIEQTGPYLLWGRLKASAASGEIFSVKIDNEPSKVCSNVMPFVSWTWVKLDSFALTEGDHMLTILPVNEEIQLDKILFTRLSDTPSHKGGAASNCDSGNQPPIAYAGSDKTIIANIDGNATLTVNSAGSLDPDGTIASYDWSKENNVIASGPKPTIDLPVGNHIITLTITDNEGATDSDVIMVTVFESTFEENTIWLEAECGEVGGNWDIRENASTSNGYYVTVKPGIQSTNHAPSTDDGLIKIQFTITTAGRYTIFGRVNCPTYDDDSFWLKMDNGTFSYYNGLKNNGWEWAEFTSFNLSEGEHTLWVGYREDGALLDKFFITKYTDTPAGMGEEAINKCENSPNDIYSLGLYENEKAVLMQNFPNPFSSSTTIAYFLPKACHVNLKAYNFYGQEI
ncbi:MAG: hypothetical protein JW798_09955, partial [Prolixibacteraceae bacterium]|nr:hypothetical protein [Prolixibacteraceae bacterium]